MVIFLREGEKSDPRVENYKNYVYFHILQIRVFYFFGEHISARSVLHVCVNTNVQSTRLKLDTPDRK